MKLYTEKQVRESFKSGFRLAMETDGGLKEGQEEYINSLTPIELPTDDEIREASPYVPQDASMDFWANQEGFIDGAKWMRDKILNK